MTHYCIRVSPAVIVAKDMKRRGQYGHIINISSMSGHRVPNGGSGGAFYAATKHALRALTEGLRQEVRSSIPALSVSPLVTGFVDDAAAQHLSCVKSAWSGVEFLLQMDRCNTPLSNADVALPEGLSG